MSSLPLTPLRTPIRRRTLESNYVVEMKGISKQFGSVSSVEPGGPGVAGRRDSWPGGRQRGGKIDLDEDTQRRARRRQRADLHKWRGKLSIRDPRDARSSGIEMIYQDLALCNNLDVARNIFLGREYTRGLPLLSILDKKKMYTESAAAAQKVEYQYQFPQVES